MPSYTVRIEPANYKGMQKIVKKGKKIDPTFTRVRFINEAIADKVKKEDK